MCGSSKQTQTSSNKSETKALKPYGAAYESILGKANTAAGAAYNPATEQRVAGLTGDQQAAFGDARANLGNWQGYMDQAGQAAAFGAAAVTGNDIANYMNPYQQNVIDATQAQFNTQNARADQQLMGNTARSYLTGSSGRDVAAALQREAQMNAQNPVIANMYSQGFQNAQSAAQADKARMLQGASALTGTAQGLQGLGLQDVNTQLGIGGLQQGQTQAEYDAATANAQAQASYPLDMINWQAGIATGLGGAAGSTSTGKSTGTTTQKSNPFQQAVGIGTAALGLFSDERVKEDVEQVGATFDGQPVYRYRYAGQPETQIGLMAQDVEQHTPEAVGSLGGIKTVDYKRATDGAVGGLGGFASGGGVAGRSFVPQAGLKAAPLPVAQAPPAQAPSLASQSADNGMAGILDSYKQAKGALDGLGNLAEKATATTDANGWTTTVKPQSAQGWSNFLGNKMGGFVSGLGFADGGAVEDETGLGSVFGNLGALDGPVMAAGGPRPLVAPTPAGGMAPPQTARVEAAKPQSSGLLGWFSDPVREGLMTAGMGMAAAQGPNWFGQGGLQGVRAYTDANQQALDNATRKEQMAQAQAQLAQRQAEAAERMKMDREQHDWTKKYQQAQIERMQQAGARGRTPAQMTMEERRAAALREGLKEGSPEFQTFVLGGRMSNPPRQMPSVLDRETTKADIGQVKEMKEAAAGAAQMLSALDNLESARGDTTWEGPYWGATATAVGSDSAQRVNSAAEEVRLGFVGKTKGAVSDAEMRIFGQATPGMGMSDEAAKPTIEGMRLVAQRAIEQAKFFDIWMRANGSLAGAPEAWDTFKNENPIIVKNKDGTHAYVPKNVDTWKRYIKQPQQPDDDGGTTYREGDVVEDDQGNQLMLQGNEWVAVQ